MSGVVASHIPQSNVPKPESPSEVKQEDENARPIAPSATPSASRGTEQPRPGTTVCQNCLTTTTPLWRRDENGQILCNACGLFFKLHGRRRPISLKTDVIKSRNRSRNTSLGRRSHPKRPRVASSPRDASPESKQRSASAERQYPAVPASAPPAHSGAHSGANLTAHSNHSNGHAHSHVHPLNSPNLNVSPAVAPVAVPPAVAPKHIPSPSVGGSPYLFDPTHQQPTPVRTPQSGFSMPGIAGCSPGLDPSPPNIQLVRGSMSELLLPRSPPEGLERVPPLQHINATELREKTTLPSIRSNDASPRNTEEHNKELATRVSELELVNDLLKRRITDLEFSESQARRTAMEAQRTAENLWKQLTALRGENEDA